MGCARRRRFCDTIREMLVYHASNAVVEKPMLVESNRLLDFGPGFYTTTNREQAIRFAASVVRKRGGKPFLNVYEFDESGFEECLLLRFDEPSERWLDYVAENRAGRYAGIRHDLVYGPVANDNVYTTIGLYLRGFMSREAAIAELRIRKLYNQLVFCAPSAFRYLKFVSAEEL